MVSLPVSSEEEEHPSIQSLLDQVGQNMLSLKEFLHLRHIYFISDVWVLCQVSGYILKLVIDCETNRFLRPHKQGGEINPPLGHCILTAVPTVDADQVLQHVLSAEDHQTIDLLKLDDHTLMEICPVSAEYMEFWSLYGQL